MGYKCDMFTHSVEFHKMHNVYFLESVIEPGRLSEHYTSSMPTAQNENREQWIAMAVL